MVTAVRTRTLTLRTTGFPDVSLDSPEFAALQGAKGFQAPPRTNRWFSGAGDGDVFRGARINRRTITLPVLVQAPNVDVLEDRLSDLAQRFAPGIGTSRLLLDEGDTRGVWYLDVVYVDGLAVEYGKTTNGGTWALVTLVLDAPDPFWTRLEPESVPIRAAGAGRGLLKGVTPLTALRQASGQTMGTVTFRNPGDARAYPVVTINGPATGALLQSGGLTVEWSGVLLVGQRRVFNHRAGTVEDPDSLVDPNRYDELGAAPKFWPVLPGVSEASVILSGDTPGVSFVTIDYNPRRWLVV